MIAAIGLGIALVIGKPLAAVVGCALVGFGIANIIPVLFSGAGRLGDVSPERALAAVATTGYLGFLSGPPLIGLMAEAAGLPLALGAVSASCALIAARAGVVSRAGVASGIATTRPEAASTARVISATV
jgi:hypothetical protein